MFDHFATHTLTLSDGVRIHARTGGQGPALLLIHGHPQSHVMWHRIAPELAKRYTVVMPDLRGCGDSDRPDPGGDDSAAYSKRIMARDMVEVMQHFGAEDFLVGGHDRGARVAHRLALDHPERVRRLFLLDIAPTLAMYERTTQAFARAYWHWFFLIQPAPLPERLIEADPVAYLHNVSGRRHAGLSAFRPEALAEYERCIAIPGTAMSICSDYRASAGIDLEHDRADRSKGHHVSAPLRVLWGQHGAVGKCFDVLALWREVSHGAVSGHAVDCGHYLAEEKPDEVLQDMLAFFQDGAAG
ncbi:alpha/beta hydrolase [Pusillimonas sp. SM2304]|uniref:alpha/beta fold hydrolase n=1 Tax=Pusillimonas sp. SM2304 TaxID=3073241 RepID=UPI0028750AA1|nr:alpha/beta hydrolase [Pusillimonas sp. SM2304]MDS1139379.1 alpha/beta hydrolase [Pusillimonas sp. SM2304]